MADENHLMYAIPGGLIAVGMKVDPVITRADNLVGNIIGHSSHMPDVLNVIDVSYYLLRRLLGVRTKASKGDAENAGQQNRIKAL